MTIINKGILISAFIGLFGSMFAFLPPAQPLPTEITNAVDTLFGFVWAWDFVLNIDALFSVLGIVVWWWVIEFTIKIVMLIIRKLSHLLS